MFFRKINEEIETSLTIPQYSEELFRLTDSNRAFLREWMPWLDGIKTEDDTLAFIKEELLRFSNGEALNLTIFFKKEIVGLVGFNKIDKKNGVGYIGYWLAEKNNGQGIMTKVVSDLILISNKIFKLKKVDIRCAIDNNKSKAIPKRLGFTYDKTIPKAEKLYDKWVDHEVYTLVLPI